MRDTTRIRRATAGARAEKTQRVCLRLCKKFRRGFAVDDTRKFPATPIRACVSSYAGFRFCSIPLSVHPIRLSICLSFRLSIHPLVRSFVDPVSHCRSTLRRKSFARATTKCYGLFINNRWIFQQAHTEYGDETDRVIGDTAWLASDLKERKPAGK